MDQITFKKIKMGKYMFVLLGLCIGVLATSCERFLDTTPEDFLTPKNYYETETQLQFALNGVYATLGSSSLYGNYMLGRMGLEADEGFNALPRELADVGGYDVSTNDIKIEAFWKELYIGINKANLLLENIDRPEMDETQRNVIEGQALFLRGYFYFLLVKSFGGVPLVLETTVSASAESIQLPRTPAREVYQQVLNDMEQAAELVEGIEQIGYSGKVSKSAVWGIMARVCLHMAGYPVNETARYADAKKWAKKVIDLNIHQLNDSFEDIFMNYMNDEYDYKESIWEVEFWGNNSDGPYKSAGMVGRLLGIKYNSDDPAIGFSPGNTHASVYLYNLYDSPHQSYSHDLRRDWTIAPFRYMNTNPVTRVFFPNIQILPRCVGKFRREAEPMPKVQGYTSTNFPLLRFADVLLMYAEADNELSDGNGPGAVAVDYVNQVRRRAHGKYLNGFGNVSERIKTIDVVAGGTGYTEAPTVTISGGGGTGATAEAVVADGVVVAINITDPGIRYTAVPSIAVAGGGGDGAEAIASLTAPTDADVSPDDIVDQVAFRDLLQQERARELAFELHRKGDLVRWGILPERMDFCRTLTSEATNSFDKDNALTYYSNASERDVLWPIPAHDIGVNPNLEQNSGW